MDYEEYVELSKYRLEKELGANTVSQIAILISAGVSFKDIASKIGCSVPDIRKVEYYYCGGPCFECGGCGWVVSGSAYTGQEQEGCTECGGFGKL